MYKNQKERELHESLLNDKNLFNDITDRYKDLAKDGIPEIFKINIVNILNYQLKLIYEVLRDNEFTNKALFKLLYLDHEKIYLFMKSNNLKCDIEWEKDGFLNSIGYPLNDLEV